MNRVDSSQVAQVLSDRRQVVPGLDGQVVLDSECPSFQACSRLPPLAIRTGRGLALVWYTHKHLKNVQY